MTKKINNFPWIAPARPEVGIKHQYQIKTKLKPPTQNVAYKRNEKSSFYLGILSNRRTYPSAVTTGIASYGYLKPVGKYETMCRYKEARNWYKTQCDESKLKNRKEKEYYIQCCK